MFCFCCLLFIIIIIFNNSISSSICKLPIRSEIYNCTFKNTNKVSIIIQYLPKLLINGVLIPCVEMGGSFRYLGRFFDFNMSNNQHMSELSSLVQDLMNDIEIKPLHPKHKLLLYSRYVLSKLSWHFTIANISKTWITEHLDSVVNGYIRKWLDIPISGTLSNVFLERNKFGLSNLSSLY